MSAWFVVHVAHGSDAKARAGLARLGIVTYCPMLREFRSVGQRHLTKRQRTAQSRGIPVVRPHVIPLFPRYLFVELDPKMLSRIVLPDVGIEGVVAANGTGGLQPYRFAQEGIDAFKALEEGDPPAIPGETPAEVIFKVGEEVRIIDGVLAEQVARIAAMPSLPITEIDSDTRLSVAIAAFGRVLDVELPIMKIAKLLT